MYKYLRINGFVQLTQLQDGWDIISKGMEESLQFESFAYSVSFLDPESSVREYLQWSEKG